MNYAADTKKQDPKHKVNNEILSGTLLQEDGYWGKENCEDYVEDTHSEEVDRLLVVVGQEL